MKIRETLWQRAWATMAWLRAVCTRLHHKGNSSAFKKKRGGGGVGGGGGGGGGGAKVSARIGTTTVQSDNSDEGELLALNL
ncbi:unnamed protein product [Ixodes pacificus]